LLVLLLGARTKQDTVGSSNHTLQSGLTAQAAQATFWSSTSWKKEKIALDYCRQEQQPQSSLGGKQAGKGRLSSIAQKIPGFLLRTVLIGG
jgi:hypothetical protein